MASVAPFDATATFRAHVARGLSYATERASGDRQAVFSQADRDLALYLPDLALRIGDDRERIYRYLLTVAPRMEQAGHRWQWLRALEHGLSYARQFADTAIEAELLLHLGYLHLLLGSYDRALEELKNSQAIFRQLEDVRGMARAQIRQAFVLRRQGQLNAAWDMANQALNLLPADDAERALGAMALGVILLERQEYQQAAITMKEALTMAVSNGDKRMESWLHEHLGAVMRRTGDFDETKYHLARSRELAPDDPVHKAVITMTLGAVHFESGEVAQALEGFLEAKEVFLQYAELPRLAIAYNNLGMAYKTLGRTEQAIDAYHASIDLWRQLGNATPLANTTAGLALVYQAQNQHQQAIELFDMALEILAGRADDPQSQKLTKRIQGYRADSLGALYKGPVA
ncbi:MAG: tetratricopeptide repeat protein [Caldilineales bacterium]|nr:tetratricopeptide repeat protein [Caldilineales bacterium]